MAGIKQKIENGECAVGIELGSTRIKAVLINDSLEIVASGVHDWENRLENGIWTYSITDILNGLKSCYAMLKADVLQQYCVTLKKVSSMGISAMMHGYMAFDKAGELLVPFRTWRNTMTLAAQEELTWEFDYPIPQRWSIAHLYQAILNGESHVRDIAQLTTLAGYVHYLLTGEKVIGIGDASGMFPIDLATKNYNGKMLEKFSGLIAKKGYPWSIGEILPKVKVAGEVCGYLSAKGAKLLDDSGDLVSGIPFCAPEGDAGTGMVATNSIKKRTGNVSAGTSIFAMVVLENQLKKPHEEIDLVTTPQGDLVAMVHCNNCTSELNAWVGLFKEYNELLGIKIDGNDMFEKLFNLSLSGDGDCGGMVAYNYFSGEQVTRFDEGRLLLIRKPDSIFSLANFIKVQIYSCFATLKLGMNILIDSEKVQIDSLLGHGGIFKTKEVAQKALAAALNIPIGTVSTAGEGGAYGIAILASYILQTDKYKALENYLDEKVFVGVEKHMVYANPIEAKGFEKFINSYKKCLTVEREAISRLV